MILSNQIHHSSICSTKCELESNPVNIVNSNNSFQFGNKISRATFSLAFQTAISRSNTDSIRIVIVVVDAVVVVVIVVDVVAAIVVVVVIVIVSPYVDDYQIKNEVGMSFETSKETPDILKSGGLSFGDLAIEVPQHFVGKQLRHCL